MEIDEKGRVNVSAKELLPKPKKEDTRAEEKHETVEKREAGEKRFFGKKEKKDE